MDKATLVVFFTLVVILSHLSFHLIPFMILNLTFLQNHLITDLLPFSEVDKDAFKNLIGGLSGPLVIRSLPFMVDLLKKAYNKSIADLILELDKADYPSTTADCWTSR